MQMENRRKRPTLAISSTIETTAPMVAGPQEIVEQKPIVVAEV
jgi:hypothetical protein